MSLSPKDGTAGNPYDGSAGNPYDGSAVNVVPQNVEKLPLYHWHPGRRLLMVGSRDGVAWDGNLDPSEARSFRRPLSVALLRQAQRRSGTTGIYTAWSESLRYPQGMQMVLEACRNDSGSAGNGESDGQGDGESAVVVGTSGFGDADLLAELVAGGQVAAWVLYIGDQLGPLLPEILSAGQHVEVVLGCEAQAVAPDLDWQRVAACHLVPRRPGDLVGGALEDSEASLRRQLPATLPVYDSSTQHSHCPCGATLVWRSGGRSRVDEDLLPTGECRQCQRPAGVLLKQV